MASSKSYVEAQSAILGVEMQAVEVDAQRHQHTQANLDGRKWFEAKSSKTVVKTLMHNKIYWK